jgi:hypothetical protein
MTIKKFGLNTSLSLILMSLSQGAYPQNKGQLKKDYATALQVAEADVEPILQKQAEAMALSGKLESTIPDDFAGMRISPSKNFSATIYLKSGDSSAISKFTTDPVYKIKKAKHSLNELYGILKEVGTVLTSNGISYAAFIDLDMQHIQVSMPDRKVAKKLLNDLEGKQQIRIVEEDITIVPTVIAGEKGTVGSYNCTTGFSVVHTDGRNGVLTAGHCPNTSMTVGSTSSISYVATLLNNTNRRDVQWHSKSSGSFDSQIKVTGGTALKVIDVGNSVVGAVICLNGATSGNRCGKITQLGQAASSAELTAPSISIQIADAVVIETPFLGGEMCAQGDSGGPVYTTTYNFAGEATALGTEFAGFLSSRIGTSTPQKFSKCLYTKIGDISALGLTIIKAPVP